MSKILIAGPCVSENSEQWIVDQAGAIVDQLAQLPGQFSWAFKCSFDKANRTKADSYRGLGLDVTLRAFERIRGLFGCRVTTDIHEVWQADKLNGIVDIIQIPAMLCRQTDLIVAAAEHAEVVNIKCGPAESTAAMIAATNKTIAAATMLTYRGTAIGASLVFLPEKLEDLSSEHRGPVLLDVTHIARDEREIPDWRPWNPMSMVAALCGAALDVDGLFLECHPNPAKALSDGRTQIKTEHLADFLGALQWAK